MSKERLNLLIAVVNSLRGKGLTEYAAELDALVRKYAQMPAAPAPAGGAPAADPLADLGGGDPMADPNAAMDPAQQGQQQPPAPEPEQQGPEAPNEKNTLQRTMFYQFEKWHSVLDRELPSFDYLGKENIAAIRSVLSGLHKAFQQAFKTKPKQYDKGAVLKWNDHVSHLVTKMHESNEYKLNDTKAIADSGMLYDTTNRLNESAQRVFGDDPAFGAVLAKFADLVRVFANVIKQTSEQVAQRDLTEVR